MFQEKVKIAPPGFELRIIDSRGQRLIHWATGAWFGWVVVCK